MEYKWVNYKEWKILSNWRKGKYHKVIGRPWQCPRCGEVHIITKDGVDHVSNIGGPHFIRWSIHDLVAMDEWEKEEFKKIKLYG